MAKKAKTAKRSSNQSPAYRTARSAVHATGLFAARDIPKGTRIIEYLGDRISHAECERRYEDKADDDNHTFLFTVDNKLVIDAGVNGNEARFANHSCDPNSESVVEDRRVFVESIRAIKKGSEINYDYNITRAPDDPRNVDEIYACRCGSKLCRGSMLEPKKVKKSAKKKPVSKKAAKKPGSKKAPTKGSVQKKAPAKKPASKKAPAKKAKRAATRL